MLDPLSPREEEILDRAHNMDVQVGQSYPHYRQGNWVPGMAQKLTLCKGRAKWAELYSEHVSFTVLLLGAQKDSRKSVLHLWLAFGKCPNAICVEKLERCPLVWEQSGRPCQHCGDPMDLRNGGRPEAILLPEHKTQGGVLT